MTKRLLSVLALLLGALIPTTPSHAAPKPRVGYTSLLAEGVGEVVEVCAVCYHHGWASVVPSSSGGALTGVTLNVMYAVSPAEAEPGARAVVSVYDRWPDDGTPLAGTPRTLLATTSTLITSLRPTAGYQRFDFPGPLRVHAGERLMLVLGVHSSDGFGYWGVGITRAPGPWLYSYHAGVWWNGVFPDGSGGAPLQLQVQTWLGPNGRS